jgi:hypothetical protein
MLAVLSRTRCRSWARFALLALLSVHAVLGISLPKRVSDGDFFDVTDGGGSWLDSGNGNLNVNYI